jgi:hypothetical protein
MPNTLRTMRGMATVGAVVLALAACQTDVTNPTLIDASTFDPSADARTISLSAQTLLYQAYQRQIEYTAFLSEEIWPADASPMSTDISRRAFNQLNPSINTFVFQPLSRAYVANATVVGILMDAADAASDVNLARAEMNAGFSLVLLGETMCTATIDDSSILTPDQVLDSAIARFNEAIRVASAAPSAPEITKILNASRVGIARAALQKGDLAEAVAAAQSVESSFAGYDVVTTNDASNLELENKIFYLSANGGLTVPPLYRALRQDVRVPSDSPGTKTTSQLFPLLLQEKYPSLATRIRIASYLEAEYIVAEVNLKQGITTDAQALIAERIAAGGPSAPPLSAAATDLLGQLMELRARDFWLEGKKLGDIRRNPDVPAYYDAPGTPFFTQSGQVFGNQTCFPLPQEEINANPNAT